MSLPIGSRDAWIARARATWDERAADWDAMSQSNTQAPDRPADLARTAAALNLSPGSAILDAGCGSGQFALAFAALGCRVTAVDLSPEMIERARAHAVTQNLTVDWRVADLTQIPEPIGAFDAIHARVSLQFVPDLAAALTEFRRVLRPGGRLYASVPGSLSPIYGRSWRRYIEPERHAVNYATPWELESLLIHLGWTILDGWGSFGANLAGDPAAASPEAVAALPLRLQQASATTWALIAE